jgi:hypothetical protein
MTNTNTEPTNELSTAADVAVAETDDAGSYSETVFDAADEYDDDGSDEEML